MSLQCLNDLKTYFNFVNDVFDALSQLIKIL